VKIVWLTGRRLSRDLASSTEMGLCRGLLERGNEVHMVSPGNRRIDEIPMHSPIKQTRIRGLHTISIGLAMNKFVSKNEDLFDWADCFLVDWRLVSFIWRTLDKKQADWWIIDRGPPAYTGLLAKIQNIQWSKAWKVAEKKSKGGFVVSRNHAKRVKKIIHSYMNIIPVPAGANIRDNLTASKTPRGKIRFVYSGVLERRRDIRGIFRLLDYFDLIENGASITIIGEGQESAFVERLAKEDERVSFTGKMSHGDVISELNSSHVGILPMPSEEIWRLASPLKLAEYLAAGMLIVGPKHEGNTIEGDFIWDLLSEDENWQLRGVQSIREILDSDGWEDASINAKFAAYEHLNWEKISKFLEENLAN